MEKEKLNELLRVVGENNITMILSNPFYCLEEVAPIFVIKHEAIITRDDFVKSGVLLINELGSEKYLNLLLDNLEGKYV